MTFVSSLLAASLAPDEESLMVVALLSFPLHTLQISLCASELSMLSQPNGYTDKEFNNFHSPSSSYIRNCYNENTTLTVQLPCIHTAEGLSWLTHLVPSITEEALTSVILPSSV